MSIPNSSINLRVGLGGLLSKEIVDQLDDIAVVQLAGILAFSIKKPNTWSRAKRPRDFLKAWKAYEKTVATATDDNLAQHILNFPRVPI